MAAWTFRLDSVQLVDLRLNLGVSYYDATDTGFTNQLYSTTLTYNSGGTTLTDIRADIVTSGQAERAAQAKLATLLAIYPVGTTGNVPQVAITIVQTAGNISDGASTLSVTITAPSAGNQLVALIQTDALNSAISMSALTSQVWSKAYGIDGASTTPDLACYLSTNPGTGTTVTLNNGSSVACAMVVIELAGTLNSGTDDGHSNSTADINTHTTWTCTSVTPGTANDVDITWLGNDTSVGVVTAPSGYTVDTNGTQNTANHHMVVARKIKVDSAAEAPQWSNTVTNTKSFAAQVLVKPASTALPPLPFVVDTAVARAASW